MLCLCACVKSGRLGFYCARRSIIFSLHIHQDVQTHIDRPLNIYIYLSLSSEALKPTYSFYGELARRELSDKKLSNVYTTLRLRDLIVHVSLRKHTTVS